MIKKPQILSILLVVLLAAFFSIAAKSDDQVGIQSKKSHAEKLWLTSGHADATAEAFIHWDEDGEVSGSCAKCHSTPGYVSFIETGTAGAQPIGTTVECDACHSDPDRGIVRDHTDVKFPSGITVEGLGPEALCMECHQGRESKISVDSRIAGAELPDDDTSSSALSFRNIHYHVAAATQFGTVVKGGYEYAGKTYDARFSHITGYNACHTCHNPHSLEVDIGGECQTCHTGVSDPKDIRYYGSFMDYNGNGNMTEGMYYELEAFKPRLYTTIRKYAKNVLGYPIVYDSHTYPYYFYDENDNGAADSDEGGYSYFSARLLRAAYNYQVSQKDPNAYAHNGKYLIELLYDSIEDLNSMLKNPVSMDGMNRNRTDEGHFNGSGEAFRHWDEDGEVSGSCAKCHSAVGLADLLELGENIAAEISNGMLCTTCHTSPPRVREFGAVEFPSGATADMGDNSNLCLNCHQGRASKKTVDAAIAASSGPYRFINIHYYPTAAILFGSEVHGGYEFAGKEYVGRRYWHNHNGQFDTCIECHMGTQSENKRFDYTGKMHNVQKPSQEDCVYCHGQDVSQPNPGADPEKFKFSGIRPASTPDYNGNGDRTESVQNEIIGLEEALYAQIQIYAATVIGTPIIYDSHSYPYFFADINGNGIIDEEDGGYGNFNARLLRAVYNYQTSKKEPHGFIHNSKYIAQLLVDSIGHLRGDVSAYKWRK
ncbi:MAG TPA: hypothetical protein VMW92_02715 [Candidatus Heimdallarchaeota archaeon]|nr:hypothetical protein [Candidatus Heimdallarchaeota archaeon]